MSEILFFENLSVDLPQDRIYQRLGYRTGVTVLSHGQRKEIQGYIQDAAGLIELKGAALRLKIKQKKVNRLVLENGLSFAGKNLVKMLDGCKEAVLMAATCGRTVVEAAGYDSQGRNVARAVVLDAAASEMADAGLGWIMEYYNRVLRREGLRVLPRRFSAGYGDFPLRQQKVIHEALMLERMGIRITDTFILMPEKSVTAITGIEKLGEPSADK